MTGIGGGENGGNGFVIINGGEVTATGDLNGIGVGAGKDGARLREDKYERII